MSDFGPELPIYSRFDKEASLDKEAAIPLLAALPWLAKAFGVFGTLYGGYQLGRHDLPGIYRAGREGDLGGLVRHGTSGAMNALMASAGLGWGAGGLRALGLSRPASKLKRVDTRIQEKLPSYLSMDPNKAQKGDFLKGTAAYMGIPMAASRLGTAMGSPPSAPIRPPSEPIRPPHAPTLGGPHPYMAQGHVYEQPNFFDALQEYGKAMGSTPAARY